MKLLVLELDGSFDSGFNARLEIRETINSRPQILTRGKLPSDQGLLEIYQQWQRRYSDLDGFFRALKHNNPEQVTNSSQQEDGMTACRNSAKKVEKTLNNWLNNSQEFAPIRNTLLRQGDNFSLWLQTNNILLQKLPWEKWDLLQESNANVAIIVSEYDIPPRNHNPNEKIKILAIIGGASDLNLKEDEKILTEIAGKTGAEIHWKQAPKPQEFKDLLRQGSWDILFFSGHSASTKNNGFEIQLTEEDRLTIADFRYSLRQATEKGLKLAIFNSCDGIGLVNRLAKEKGMILPHLILMREKLPDPISPKFLEYFLNSFTINKSLYESVQSAQKILSEDWEKKYPCASWLPVVCPNPTEVPPTWNSLSLAAKKQQNRRLFRTALALSLGVTALLIGVRELGVLEGLELFAYDKMMQLRPQEKKDIDERIVVITIGNDDFKYQDNQGMVRAKYKGKPRSLAGEALSQLLTKLQPYQPAAIGVDILRDFPSQEDYPSLADQLRESDHLFMICSDVENATPPPELNNPNHNGFNVKNRIGYSDIITDNDGIVRRFLWSANFGEDSQCLPSKVSSQPAFSVLLAQHYLATQTNTPLDYEKLKDGIWETQRNQVRLTAWLQGGFYRNQKPTEGYQFMLNYGNFPKTIAISYSLQDVLKDDSNFNPEFVRGKIVLVGLIAKELDSNGKEYKIDGFLTPLAGEQKEMDGVFIHAHMISQILSAVLDDRPLLLPLSQPLEIIWIVSWSLIGGLLGWYFCKTKIILIAEGIAMIILSGVSWLLFLQGCVVPYVPSLLALTITGGGMVITRVKVAKIKEIKIGP